MRLRGWVLVPLVFAVYLLTTAPGMYWRDCPEMLMVAYGLDISHPAGSPAYAMLGKLATMLPLGSIAFRVNLLSGLMVAFAAWAVFAAAVRLIRRFLPQEAPHWCIELPAFLAAAMAAFSLSLWQWSVVAEVYSMEVLVLATAVALALGPDASQVNRGARPELCFLLLGLGTGVHINLVLGVPFFALYFILQKPAPRARTFFLMVLAFAVGVSVYFYLPARSLAQPPYDHGNPETLKGLIIHVTGMTHVDSPMRASPWPVIRRNLSMIPGWTASEFGLIYAVLAWMGAVMMIARPRLALLLYGVIFSNVYLFARTWNVSFGYISTFVILAVAGAVPMAMMLWRLSRLKGGRRFEQDAAGRVFIALAAAAAFVAPAAANYPLCDMHAFRTQDRLARTMIDGAPPTAAIVTYNSGLSYPFFCLQTVWRARPDIVHLHRSHLSDPEYVASTYPHMGALAQSAGGSTELRQSLANLAETRPLFMDYTLNQNPIMSPKELFPMGVLAFYSRSGDSNAPALLGVGQDPVFEAEIMPVIVDVLSDRRDWSGRQLMAQICMVRARMALDRGNEDVAQEWFARAARLTIPMERPFVSTPYTSPLINMAQLELIQNRDPRAAAEWIDKGLLVDGMDTNLLLLKYQLLKDGPNADEALEYLRLADSIAPGDPNIALTLAEDLLKRGNNGEAKEVLVRITRLPLAMTRQQSKFARAHVMLARIEGNGGNLEAATSHYLAAIGLLPDSPNLHIEFGWILQDYGRPEQGKEQVKLGIKLALHSALDKALRESL